MSEQACLSLAGEMEKVELGGSFIAALKGERAEGIWVFEALRSGKLQELAEKAEGQAGSKPEEQAPGRRGMSFRPGPPMTWWFAADEARYLELMAEGIRQAPLPYREVAAVHPTVAEKVSSHRWWQPGLTTAILVPEFVRCQQKRDQAIGQLGLDQIALLLKAYKARFGIYPETLEKLQDYAGHPLPEDPFSGKPFVFRREGAGFLLYSWGPSLRDDKGTPLDYKSREGSVVPKGDMVFRCVR